MGAASPGVVIVGGGLAGGLLALALRELGAPVTLIDAAPAETSVESASAISYGAVPGWPLAPTPLARLAARAPRLWRRLQRRHGALGWRASGLRLHGENPALRGLSRLGVLPFGQVDTAVLDRRWPELLAAAGVERITAAVQRLDPLPGGGAALALPNGSRLRAAVMVLAAGSGCRRLWPQLPDRCRTSWAAVLALPAVPAALGRGVCWLPQRFARVPLERRAGQLQAPEWVLDPGLVPWGHGALLGQLTLVRPALGAGLPPEAAGIELQLRQALATDPWGAPLAALPGALRQAAVAFCSDGLPLVGLLAPGIWAFTGFSAGFSQAPVLAPLLARCLVGAAEAGAAQTELRRLGLWPLHPGADTGGGLQQAGPHDSDRPSPRHA
ncbi:MAG: hypothetical protein RLZZ423_1178 [Cyanobacteriota bacterium]|jgi:glycine/D-amino acid oxidase-like deaminating enzyme